MAAGVFAVVIALLTTVWLSVRGRQPAEVSYNIPAAQKSFGQSMAHPLLLLQTEGRLSCLLSESILPRISPGGRRMVLPPVMAPR